MIPVLGFGDVYFSVLFFKGILVYADCVVTGDVADEVMDTSKDEDTDEEDENSDEGCRMSTNYDPDEMFDCPLICA